MNRTVYSMMLDVNEMRDQAAIPVTLGDTARSLVITLTSAGVPYTITDRCRAIFAAKKPDGTVLLDECEIEDGARIRYRFTGQTASAEGVVNCQLLIYGVDGDLLVSPRFSLTVAARVVSGEDMISTSERPVVDAMIAGEASRVLAEEERREAELTRLRDESDRHTAESLRASEEKSRISAENARKSAEASRAEAELERRASETKRQTAEQERTLAEQERALAEQERILAERERAVNYGGFNVRIGANQKRIANLERRISPDPFVIDESVAYKRDIPMGVLPYAAITEFGGMTHRDEETGALQSAAITAITVQGKNRIDMMNPSSGASAMQIVDERTVRITANISYSYKTVWQVTVEPSTTYTISFKTSNLVNASSYLLVVYNFDTKTESYHGNTNTLSVRSDAQGRIRFHIGGNNPAVPSSVAVTMDVSELQLEKGTAATAYSPFVSRTVAVPREILTLEGYGLGIDEACFNRLVLDDTDGGRKWIRACEKRAYQRGDELLRNVVTDGVSETVCALESPVETDVSAAMPEDFFIEVEGGGSLVAENEYGYAVPLTVKYMTKEGSA